MAATRSSARTSRWPVGLAFAIKYRGEDRVTLCFFGDGAINQGSFHEALNLAALYKLPIIFICENNLFAMGTSVKRSTSLKQIVDRAEGYDIPGEIVDGMNFREVRDKLCREVAESIRKDPHPAFLEVRTYRYRGHSMSDPGELSNQGRTREISSGRSDHASARAAYARRKTDERTVRSARQAAKGIVLAQCKVRRESPEPPLEKLYDYTYAPTEQRMREITYRQALNEALAEELERDPNVFLMGEEVAEYNGAYKVSQGCSSASAPTHHRHADQRKRICRPGVGAAMVGLRPIIEFMTFSFSLVAFDQVVNNAPNMLTMSAANSISRSRFVDRTVRRISSARPIRTPPNVLCQRARPEGLHAGHPARR
jgi:2-oxoisovalerate dehydrogenase E1 component